MNQLIDALSTQGYFVWDDFLTHEEVVALRDC
ncbi:SM-20 protein, partial [Vibrio cyclitrophicus]